MKIFWDTNLFIYLWESGPHTKKIEELSQFIDSESHQLATSSLSVAEILVHPARKNRPDLITSYLDAFKSIHIVDFDLRCATIFAQLLSKKPHLRPPDAIQLSCAAVSGCDLFITNDDRLSKIQIPEIKRIRSLSRWST